MTTKRFKKMMTELIDDGYNFVVDSIDMAGLRNDIKKQGFDDIMLVTGKDADDIFLMIIQKVKI